MSLRWDCEFLIFENGRKMVVVLCCVSAPFSFNSQVLGHWNWGTIYRGWLGQEDWWLVWRIKGILEFWLWDICTIFFLLSLALKKMGYLGLRMRDYRLIMKCNGGGKELLHFLCFFFHFLNKNKIIKIHDMMNKNME